MTNFDPGGFLVLLTVIPSVVAGGLSIGAARLAARFGYADYETAVVAALGGLIVAWIGASLLVSTAMLRILAVTLSMAGAFAATRSVTASSYGWVLGVLLLFVAFLGLSALGVYQGVDRTGTPQGLLSRHLMASYYGGLFAFGAVGGKVAGAVRHRFRFRS